MLARHRCTRERERHGALDLAEIFDFVIKLLDILTDGPVLLLVLFFFFRRPIGAFVGALFQDYIPDLLRQLKRIKVGPVEMEIVRDVEDHSPALRALLSSRIALQDLLDGQAEHVDDSAIEDAATDDEAEAVDEEEEPIGSAISEFEAAQRAVAKLRGKKP